MFADLGFTMISNCCRFLAPLVYSMCLTKKCKQVCVLMDQSCSTNADVLYNNKSSWFYQEWYSNPVWTAHNNIKINVYTQLGQKMQAWDRDLSPLWQKWRKAVSSNLMPRWACRGFIDWYVCNIFVQEQYLCQWHRSECEFRTVPCNRQSLKRFTGCISGITPWCWNGFTAPH